jgi:transcriptional regulator with XRE-family HTH domain
MNGPIEFGAQPGKKSRLHPSGMALLETIYFRTGAAAATEYLLRMLNPQGDPEPYFVAMAARVSGQVRTDLSFADQMQYINFNPPGFWNAPYSIDQVVYGDRPKEDFAFDAGEELVIPTKGELKHHFFWTPGGSVPTRIALNPPTTVGSILRINPQVPHNSWAASGEATAWVIRRHGGYGRNELSGDGLSMSAIRPPARHRTAVELSQPGRYAMVAWGISEMVRYARLRAGVSTTELAHHIGVDPSSLSRLEEAKANVSIEMLLKVCQALSIGIDQRIESGSWIWQRADFDQSQSSRGNSVLEAPPGTHALHPSAYQFSADETDVLDTAYDCASAGYSSWMVVKGRVIFELSESLGSNSLLLDKGSVVHFRKNGRLRVRALEDSSLMCIVFNATCQCAKKVVSPKEQTPKPIPYSDVASKSAGR